MLYLLTHREAVLRPMMEALADVERSVRACSVCHNLDEQDPCSICVDQGRDASVLCVVEQVGDLWALERSGAFAGRYHVLGGTLSALGGVGPDDLTIEGLVARAAAPPVREVILALNATVDGQTTAHVLTDRLAATGVGVTRLAHGMPLGAEVGTMDDGTLAAAVKSRYTL